MDAKTIQVLSRAMYIMAQRLGGAVEFTKEEMEGVSTDDCAITLNVSEDSKVLTLRAFSQAAAEQQAKEEGLRKVSPQGSSGGDKSPR